MIVDAFMEKLDEMAGRSTMLRGFTATKQFYGQDKIVQDLHSNGDNDSQAFTWCFENYIKDAQWMIECGCGLGLVSLGVNLKHGIRVLGIDGAQVYIDQAQELKERNGVTGVIFRRMNIENIDEGTVVDFDVAYSQHVLEHLQDPAKALRGMKKVAKAVCGFIPYDHENDCTEEHLSHWNDEQLLTLLKKVFKNPQVKRFGTVVAFGARSED